MYVDFITTAALARELRDTLAGSRVQDVLQPDRLSLALEMYAGERLYLTLTADPNREGLLLSQTRARRGEGASSQLAQSARSRLMGARLVHVGQPPNERLMRFSFKAETPVQLVAELTGKMANVILLDADDTVIAAARHVTPAMTSTRVVLPGHQYSLPPKQRKAAWDDVTESDLASWCRARPESATWRMLVRSVRGMSPLAAREIAHRAGADPNDAAGEQSASALRDALRDVFGSVLGGAAVPTVARSRDGDHVVAYAPYRLTHLTGADTSGDEGRADGTGDGDAAGGDGTGDGDGAGGALVTDEPSIARALEIFEVDRLGRDPYRDARAAVAAALDGASDRATRRLASLEEEQVDEAELDRLRLTGDMILTYQRQIGPGQTELVGTLDLDAPPLVARLDPDLTPVENAQSYYDRYSRKSKAAAALPGLKALVLAEMETLDQLRADLDLAENRAEIDAVADALADVRRELGPSPPSAGETEGSAAARGGAGRGKGAAASPGSKNRGAGSSSTGRRKSHGKPAGPLRLTSSDGFPLLVGRNSTQNEAVTFGKAARDDVWVHARGLPGGHVVVRSGGRDVPEQTLLEAAGLALFYSAARDESRGEAIVTKVRYVRRLKGGGPGMVRYEREATIVASPLDPAELGD